MGVRRDEMGFMRTYVGLASLERLMLMMVQ